MSENEGQCKTRKRSAGWTATLEGPLQNRLERDIRNAKGLHRCFSLK